MVNDRRYDEALELAQRDDADLARAAVLLQAAHEAGDLRAAYALATWYLHGKYFRRNVRTAVRLLREAAAENVGDALYDLAVCYEEGCGVSKNAGKAAALYLQAALQGERQSVWELGRCYYHGIGVKADRKIARVWFARAEELGIVD